MLIKAFSSSYILSLQITIMSQNFIPFFVTDTGNYAHNRKIEGLIDLPILRKEFRRK